MIIVEKKHILIFLSIIIMSVSAIVFINRHDDMTAQTIKTKGIVTGDMRVEFIEQLGLLVEENSYGYEDVQIPQEFDDVYENYNAIQKRNGFDLEKYKGKDATKFTYTVKQYPGYENEKVYVNLLIYKGRIIGGDICTARTDGFMVGLYEGQQNSQNTAF